MMASSLWANKIQEVLCLFVPEYAKLQKQVQWIL